MKKGKFVISLDTEIAWGWMSFHPQRQNFFPLYQETQRVIRRLLDLFEKYDVPVTWAIVGRLLEQEEERKVYYSKDINELFPGISTAELYQELPTNFLSFETLAEEIAERKTPHELGSHTYNHLFTNNINQENQAALVEDFTAMETIFEKKLKTKPVSFVFPKNQVRYQEQIKRISSIRIYRAPDIYWFSKYPCFLKKILSLLDHLIPVKPLVFDLKRDKSGLKYIEGSLLFRKSHIGIKKYFPIQVIQKKALKGINAAIEQGKIFHLWFHPFNFAFQEEAHFKALETVLKYAQSKRSEGKLEIVTMEQLISVEHGGY